MVSNSPTSTGMITQSAAFGFAGLFLGVIVDKIFAKARAKFPDQKMKILLTVLQMIVLVLTIVSIYVASKDTAMHFQSTIAGMPFPAMFFGVQSDLFTTVQSLL